MYRHTYIHNTYTCLFCLHIYINPGNGCNAGNGAWMKWSHCSNGSFCSAKHVLAKIIIVRILINNCHGHGWKWGAEPTRMQMRCHDGSSQSRNKRACTTHARMWSETTRTIGRLYRLDGKDYVSDARGSGQVAYCITMKLREQHWARAIAYNWCHDRRKNKLQQANNKHNGVKVVLEADEVTISAMLSLVI